MYVMAELVETLPQITTEKVSDGAAVTCAPSEEVMTLFSSLQNIFETEQDAREKIRAVVREVEQATRAIHTSIQTVHQCTAREIPELCAKTRPMFGAVKSLLTPLKELVPLDSYYRYHDHWRFALQRLSFVASFVIYLETGKLATRSEVAQMIGVQVKSEEGFHIDLDDFLMGVVSMTNELSRLAVNSVILGDYNRPFEISAFLSDVTAGFRLLNLKNDFLRKKFDSLKYDVKKVEEVVYDISIRGLKPKE